MSMDTVLRAKLTFTYRGEPLAQFANIPGYDAEMTPQQMRSLAAALLQVANDSVLRLLERGRRNG